MFCRIICIFAILIGFTTSDDVYETNVIVESFTTASRETALDRFKREITTPYPGWMPTMPPEDEWSHQLYFENLTDEAMKSCDAEKDEMKCLRQIKLDPNYIEASKSCKANRTRPNCNSSSLYRMYDGTCNNLKNPTWGSVNDCLQRLIPASYNGASGIRQSVTGGPLPEPRDLSLSINIDLDQPTNDVSNLFTIFGQAVAHDMAFSTPPVGPGLLFDCCQTSNDTDFRCFPISIRPNDTFFSSRNITCINFSRAVPCSTCDVGQRQLRTTVTGALDMSILYGNSEDQANGLRANDGTGRLKSRRIEEGEILPENTELVLEFCTPDMLSDCFQAGDNRVNQHTPLTTMHTLFLREHNRIVGVLKKLHPGWSDEQLYQTARRILGGMIQSIVYKEYLPSLLGPHFMKRYRLRVGEAKSDCRTHYNSKIRFGMFAEHETAGYRLHSMIASVTGYRPFHTLYSNPFPIYQAQMPLILGGLCRTASQMFDRYFTEDTTNLLYQLPGDDFGLDLAAIDIQRGRDHGLPTYVNMLRYCSREHITSFNDLNKVMDRKNVDLLKENYKTVEDIDLTIGIHLEPKIKRAVVSRTAACIMAEQFYNAKYGDRFYFEHADQVPSFTTAQLETLKKATISRMLCDNTNFTELQMNALLLTSKSNPVLPCEEHHQVDLSLF